MLVGKVYEGVSPREEFALVRVMGEPGGEVFEARARDGRLVVLRFWRPLVELDARLVIDRVNQASRVRQPMIAAVHGVQQFADGTLCLVSEYVPGRTLDAWVSAHGLPQLPIAVDFIRRLALALSAPHQRGMSHHALYPGNVIVVEPDTKPSGRIVAKLVDLGVPRMIRPAPRFEAAHFMAPEALVAELQSDARPLAADASMNVYSCGCLLHYLCTGQPPFQSDSLEGLSALHGSGVRASPRRFNPDVPDSLERVIVHALELEPKRRTVSAADLAAALSYVESMWRHSGVRPRMPPPPPAAKVDPPPSVVPAFDLVVSAARPSVPPESVGPSPLFAEEPSPSPEASIDFGRVSGDWAPARAPSPSPFERNSEAPAPDSSSRPDGRVAVVPPRVDGRPSMFGSPADGARRRTSTIPPPPPSIAGRRNTMPGAAPRSVSRPSSFGVPGVHRPSVPVEADARRESGVAGRRETRSSIPAARRIGVFPFDRVGDPANPVAVPGPAAPRRENRKVTRETVVGRRTRPPEDIQPATVGADVSAVAGAVAGQAPNESAELKAGTSAEPARIPAGAFQAVVGDSALEPAGVTPPLARELESVSHESSKLDEERTPDSLRDGEIELGTRHTETEWPRVIVTPAPHQPVAVAAESVDTQPTSAPVAFAAENVPVTPGVSEIAPASDPTAAGVGVGEQGESREQSRELGDRRTAPQWPRVLIAPAARDSANADDERVSEPVVRPEENTPLEPASRNQPFAQLGEAETRDARDSAADHEAESRPSFAAEIISDKAALTESRRAIKAKVMRRVKAAAVAPSSEPKIPSDAPASATSIALAAKPQPLAPVERTRKPLSWPLRISSLRRREARSSTDEKSVVLDPSETPEPETVRVAEAALPASEARESAPQDSTPEVSATAPEVTSHDMLEVPEPAPAAEAMLAETGADEPRMDEPALAANESASTFTSSDEVTEITDLAAAAQAMSTETEPHESLTSEPSVAIGVTASTVAPSLEAQVPELTGIAAEAVVAENRTLEPDGFELNVAIDAAVNSVALDATEIPARASFEDAAMVADSTLEVNRTADETSRMDASPEVQPVEPAHAAETVSSSVASDTVADPVVATVEHAQTAPIADAKSSRTSKPADRLNAAWPHRSANTISRAPAAVLSARVPKAVVAAVRRAVAAKGASEAALGATPPIQPATPTPAVTNDATEESLVARAAQVAPVITTPVVPHEGTEASFVFSTPPLAPRTVTPRVTKARTGASVAVPTSRVAPRTPTLRGIRETDRESLVRLRPQTAVPTRSLVDVSTDEPSVSMPPPAAPATPNTAETADVSASSIRSTFGAPAASPDSTRREFEIPNWLDPSEALTPISSPDRIAESVHALTTTRLEATELTQPPVRAARKRDSEDAAMMLLEVIERNSLSPLELRGRASAVNPREDVVASPTPTRRERAVRYWPWFAATGAAAIVCASVLGVSRKPGSHRPAPQLQTSAATSSQVVRAEGQVFPVTSEWQPALEPSVDSDPNPPQVAMLEQSPRLQPPRTAPELAPPAERKLIPRVQSTELRARRERSAKFHSIVEPLIAETKVAPQAVPEPVRATPTVISLTDSRWTSPSFVSASEPPKARVAPMIVAQAPTAPVVEARQLPATLRTEALEVRGSLSDLTMRRAVDRIRPQLTECFTQHPSASEKVSTAHIQVTIDENGRARSPQVDGADSPALDQCLEQAAKKLVSGAPDTGTVKVAWNLRYGR